MSNHRSIAVALLLGTGLASCGGDDDAASSSTVPVGTTIEPTADQRPAGSDDVGTSEDRFPDVVDAEASFDDADGTWSFAVTISSPYDTPERYADGWRVIGPDGTVYGTHMLMHDHAAEQPFTRTQRGVAIPEDVGEVTIEGRDQANGFGGGTVVVPLVRG